MDTDNQVLVSASITLTLGKICLRKYADPNETAQNGGVHPALTISGPEVIKLFSCSTQLSMKF